MNQHLYEIFQILLVLQLLFVSDLIFTTAERAWQSIVTKDMQIHRQNTSRLIHATKQSNSDTGILNLDTHCYRY